MKRTLLRSLGSLVASSALAAGLIHCSIQTGSGGTGLPRNNEELRDAAGQVIGDGNVAARVSFEMHLERFDTKTGTFESLPAPPTKRNLFNVGHTRNKVVVFGGVDEDGDRHIRVDVYDTTTKTWSKGADFARSRTVSTVEVGDLICAVGGYTNKIDEAVPDVDCYDAEKNEWSQRAAIPERIDVIAPVVYGGKIWLLGGMRNQKDGFSVPLTSTYSYDPVTDKWEPSTPLTKPRGMAGVEAVGDKIYVVGGFSAPISGSSNKERDRDMIVFDPATKRWADAPQMPATRTLFATDGVGGALTAYFGISTGALLDRFDPGIGQWRAGTEPSEKIDPGAYSKVTLGGSIYLLVILDNVDTGGTKASGKLWKYDVAADKWSIAGQRSPDGRDALFLGTAIEDSLYFVGSFTTFSVVKK